MASTASAVSAVRGARSLRRGARRISPLTWAVIAGRGGLIGRRHWQLLPPKKRRRLRELLAKSRGRPSNLSADERAEVQKLVSKLELRRLGVDLAALASPVPLPGQRDKRKRHG